MQWNHETRQALLTACVCFALSAPAFAMPTGGTVASGDVTGLTNGEVTSGATITANKNSIINWQEFGIKEGETLNFNTENGALLNRVTGAKISELLGTLKQSGGQPLLLVNPNGIVVGSNAVIDAHALVLSTLALSDEEFKKMNFATEEDTGITGTGTLGGNGTAGALTIAKGAKINIDNLLALFGGTVNVADGVVFTMTGDQADDDTEDVALNVAAGNKITMHGGDIDYQDVMGNVTATNANTVTFHGTVNNTSDSLNTTVTGGKVDMSGATMNLAGDGSVYVTAATSQTDAGQTLTTNATKDNTITADGLTIKDGEQVQLMGGAVDVKNSTITGKQVTGVYAGNTIKTSMDENDNPTWTDVTAATKDNAITLDKTTITSTLANTSANEEQGDTGIQGGAVTLQNGTNVKSAGTITISAAQSITGNKMTAGAGNTVKIDKTSSVTPGGSEEDVDIFGNKLSIDGTINVASKENLNTGEGSVMHYDETEGIVVDKASEADATDNPGGGSTDNPGGGDTPMTPVTPTDPTQDPNAQPFNAEDAKNIASGETMAAEVIEKNANLAQRQEALVNTIEKLNDATQERAAAGQVIGILQGIKNADLTTTEKQVLQLSVLNAYEPTQGRAEDSDQKTQDGNVTTAVAATDTQAVSAAITAGEAAEETPVALNE
ncbi:filamentous hemagglutinin N-terminal domain-containing protein [uncultured Selenomonas sp.]|uniref:two-partner secretion domain-containing protein n=1 Tax=uncultured Selenomonas sp. TaxID=159275 RepID=UPI0025E15FBC|nr:filamentous hemagglutinin N-terminal domain-containing protein [uncultured Selenomonas sp.]